jgi:hypothetical protein
MASVSLKELPVIGWLELNDDILSDCISCQYAIDDH